MGPPLTKNVEIDKTPLTTCLHNSGPPNCYQFLGLNGDKDPVCLYRELKWEISDEYESKTGKGKTVDVGVPGFLRISGICGVCIT